MNWSGVNYLLITFILVVNSNCKMIKKTYVSNPDLETIKYDYRGNIIFDGQFANGEAKEKAPLWDVIKWKSSRNQQREEKKNDSFCLVIQDDTTFIPDSSDVIVWLGHASFFIRIGGVTFLTDPCFYDIGYIKRRAGLPFRPEDITGIDYLLVSHLHHDHFNIASVEVLRKNNPNMEMLMPLNASLFIENEKKLAGMVYQEAGWFQKYNLPGNLEVVFLPAKHWNRRGLNDFNTVLWGSFLVRLNGQSIFFTGDSAYGGHFNSIADEVGEIDICVMPIGSYKPTFLMKHEHMNPLEAIHAFNDLNGEVFIPMHYGTYDLSDEPLGEPLRLLRENSEAINGKLMTLDVGQVFLFAPRIVKN